jgi:hypothetical protein
MYSLFFYKRAVTSKLVAQHKGKRLTAQVITVIFAAKTTFNG